MSTPIVITLNGEPRELASGTSLADLVEELGLSERTLAIERNREVVPKARHAEVLVVADDVIEIVSFVGGG